MRRKRKDGKVTKREIEEALRQFFAANNIKIALNIDIVITLLESLALTFKVKGEDDTYMFPAHLPFKLWPEMWIKDENKKVYVGRRSQCCSDTSIFSPTSFSLFQCKACISLDRRATLWRDGMIVTKVDSAPFQVQCLVAMTKPLGAVDFVVRGSQGSESECFSLLKDTLSLWTEVVEDYSAGTEYETRYLSKQLLFEHRVKMDSYTEEQVKQATAQGHGGLIQYATDDENFTEAVSDLMVFPPRPQGVNRVARAVARYGSAMWFELGLELRLTSDEITGVTYDKPQPSNKLLAIFQFKADKAGEETAETLFLEACKVLQTPIYAAVMEELSSN